MNLLPFLLLALLFLASCEKSDSNVLPREQLVRAYADLMEVSILTQQTGRDSAAATHAIDSVLTKENVTRERLMTSVRWYSRDVHNWNEILDEVGKELDRRRAQH